MNKPWDNEPTPITDKHAYEFFESYAEVIAAEYSRDLERRMRAAERLLDHALEHCGRSFTAQNIEAHLETAKKENKQ